MAMANGGGDGNSDNDKVTCVWKGIKNSGNMTTSSAKNRQ
jgi:hypothetical protein